MRLKGQYLMNKESKVHEKKIMAEEWIDYYGINLLLCNHIRNF